MSNFYATITQLYAFFDERTVNELSNDSDSETANTTKLNTLLDAAASELDSVLAGRWPTQAEATDVEWPRPLVLTRWVCAKTMESLYTRRSDMPPAVEREVSWAERFEQRLIDGEISMPAQGRSNGPELLAAKGSGQGADRVTDNVLNLGFGPIDIREGGPD